MCLEQKSENLNPPPPIFEMQIIGLIWDQNSEFDHYNLIDYIFGYSSFGFFVKTPDSDPMSKTSTKKFFLIPKK